ncbi:MAG: very short patch repair endonuclease [Thermoplasmata archaeon]|nr:very short patch repair endonuclease [Thermoplasmata archaeon]
MVFRRAMLAVFVHGCFWHRCPRCRFSLPKTHTDWWRAKFARNRSRDRAKESALRSGGWRVLTLWECEISANPDSCARRVERGLRVVRPRALPSLEGELSSAH